MPMYYNDKDMQLCHE